MENKIAFFHPYFRDGGVEKTNIRLAKYFLAMGYKVDFVALTFSPHYEQDMRALGINQVELGAQKTMLAVPKLRSYIEEQRRKYKLTVVSCQNYANLVMIYSWPKDRAGIKLIVSERSQVDELKYNGKKLKSTLIKWLMGRHYRRADAIVANSQETADDLTKLTGKEAICIYNPTLSENYTSLAMQKVEHAWFKEDPPIVIGVGRLSQAKGFDELILAFEQVRRETNARLVIVGDGECKEELQQLIVQRELTDCVWLAGFDANPYKYIAKASVFVLASKYEGLPNVLIEALALGVPCVSTNCKSGPKEILLDGKGGALVEVGNVEQLARAILWSLQHQDIAKKKLALAREELYRFTPQEAGSKYLEVVEK